MKKTFLSLAVIGLIAFTSCKKETETTENTTATEETTTEETVSTEEATTVETTESTDSSVPQFEDAEIQKFVDELNAFYKEVVEATKSGDQAKVAELQQKSVEWATKMQEVTQKLSPEDAKKIQEWSATLADPDKMGK